MMSPMCAGCLRHMYDCKRITPLFEDFERYPLGGLTPRGRRAFRETWAWQSEWRPAFCRECDTQHDHRKSPGLLYRLRRRLKR